uniref:Si:dkey-174c13.2 n=1 Tax=Iconisemion striatum TaxID=60296 RepID=A0A1A7XTZ6_9TELE
MEKLDDVTVSILKAASIDECMLLTLSRDDLRDLFPGPEHFIRRKHVWSIIHPEEDHPVPQKPETTTSPRVVATASPQTPDDNKSQQKTLQLPSPPEYVVYTDSELEQCRKSYFELARTGREHECVMSKELRCRLVRNTIISMVSLLRASQGQMERYPSKTEITAMAKIIVEYYPMLQDKNASMKHESINAKLQKRLQNIKTPVKKQGPTPDRGRPKRRLTDISPSDEADDEDADRSSSSGGSTLLLSPASNSDDASTSSNKDSRQIQARHYKTLQEMCKKPKPNQQDVSQLLDLEFEARRAFIDSDSMKEENRVSIILEAYPCFKELHHALGELRRILDPHSDKFISQIKLRWEEFCSMVQFYGVSKKAMNPPMTMDKTEAHLALMKALPTLFPSPALPPKKMGTASEAFLHVLKPTEDPNAVLQKRSLSCPVVMFDGCKCVIAVGNLPVTTFDNEKLGEAMIYVMAYFYALHLTYPKCVATLLSVIQTEVLQDAIHERDTTSSYKKALAEWHAFIGK